MFLGEYKHQTDEKFRLRLPSAFKKLLGNEYYALKGTNGCLFVFTKNYLQTVLSEKINQTSLFDERVQKPLRLLLSSAFLLEEDNQGRILLPKSLREFATINKDVVILGLGNHIEIWDSEKWNEYQTSENAFDTVLEGLKEYGI